MPKPNEFKAMELKKEASEDSFEARGKAMDAAVEDEEGFLVIPLTAQERKTRDLITLKRSQFETDDYVKLV